jgi:hypothetical protein
MFSFTPWPLYPKEKVLASIGGKLDVPQSLSGHSGVEKNFLALSEIEPRPSSTYSVAIPTEIQLCDSILVIISQLPLFLKIKIKFIRSPWLVFSSPINV